MDPIDHARLQATEIAVNVLFLEMDNFKNRLTEHQQVLDNAFTAMQELTKSITYIELILKRMHNEADEH
jgi:peptidoglycan hydrolase CwlO-like protein